MEPKIQAILLRRPQVELITGLKRSSIYNRLNKNSPHYDVSFPKPISLSSTEKGSVAWVADEVYRWVNDKIAASRSDQSRA